MVFDEPCLRLVIASILSCMVLVGKRDRVHYKSFDEPLFIGKPSRPGGFVPGTAGLKREPLVSEEHESHRTTRLKTSKTKSNKN